MNYPIQIVGAVVDIHNLTMYKADGDTIVIPQGDPRIKRITEKLVPALESSEGVYFLTAEDMDGMNFYADTEKKTNGFVRFFKMARAKLAEIADRFCEPVKPLKMGKIEPEMVVTVTGEEIGQALEEPKAKLPPVEERPLTRGEAAVAEIIANARSSGHSSFNRKTDDSEDEVIVAVTSDNVVIPGVEQLAVQMQAVSEGVTSGDGMTKFMQRAASVKRGHSVEDLLKFIQKGELPLADDGTVLVYKRLESTGEEGVFVDVHSKNVRQRVGSFVHMDENMVDANRSRDCSNGLHVARRDYLSAFSGDVTVLAKLAPEDVIAVPQYDARKLRAKGYHIIAVLSPEDASRVCRNQAMLDTELLANAVAGNHVGILEYVKITKAKGGGLVITPASEVAEVPQNEVREVHSLDNLKETNDKPTTVDARSLALDLAKGKDTTVQTTVEDGKVTKVEEMFQAPPAGMVVKSEPVGEATPVPAGVTGGYADGDSYRQQADPQPVAAKTNQTKRPVDILVDNFVADKNVTNAEALVKFKKSSKKSWTALGIHIDVWGHAVTLLDTVKEVEAIAPVVPVEPPVKKVTRKEPAREKATSPAPQQIAKAPAKAKPTPAKPGTTVKVKKMTQQEEMAKLVGLYEKNPDKANARAIYAFKQKAKKGWDVLGVTDTKFIKKITERAKL